MSTLVLDYIPDIKLKKPFVFDIKNEGDYLLATLKGKVFGITGYNEEVLKTNIVQSIRIIYNQIMEHKEPDGFDKYLVNLYSDFLDTDYKTIEKKIAPKYLKDIVDGKKTFEFRNNDEDYQIGDILILKEWTDNKYTGKQIKTVITYIITGREINEIYKDCIDNSYVILGIKVIKEKGENVSTI